MFIFVRQIQTFTTFNLNVEKLKLFFARLTFNSISAKEENAGIHPSVDIKILNGKNRLC
jgi:hypothetical protein